ncbi:hypothetical protein HDU93_003222 [Gonapodya sp. JEL0774]|nr:hypothetical protein HDU93_003222 [Gonapodya sp. JEL0774]
MFDASMPPMTDNVALNQFLVMGRDFLSATTTDSVDGLTAVLIELHINLSTTNVGMPGREQGTDALLRLTCNNIRLFISVGQKLLEDLPSSILASSRLSSILTLHSLLSVLYTHPRSFASSIATISGDLFTSEYPIHFLLACIGLCFEVPATSRWWLLERVEAARVDDRESIAIACAVAASKLLKECFMWNEKNKSRPLAASKGRTFSQIERRNVTASNSLVLDSEKVSVVLASLMLKLVSVISTSKDTVPRECSSRSLLSSVATATLSFLRSGKDARTVFARPPSEPPFADRERASFITGVPGTTALSALIVSLLDSASRQNLLDTFDSALQLLVPPLSLLLLNPDSPNSPEPLQLELYFWRAMFDCVTQHLGSVAALLRSNTPPSALLRNRHLVPCLDILINCFVSLQRLNTQSGSQMQHLKPLPAYSPLLHVRAWLRAEHRTIPIPSSSMVLQDFLLEVSPALARDLVRILIALSGSGREVEIASDRCVKLFTNLAFGVSEVAAHVETARTTDGLPPLDRTEEVWKEVEGTRRRGERRAENDNENLVPGLVKLLIPMALHVARVDGDRSENGNKRKRTADHTFPVAANRKAAQQMPPESSTSCSDRAFRLLHMLSKSSLAVLSIAEYNQLDALLKVPLEISVSTETRNNTTLKHDEFRLERAFRILSAITQDARVRQRLREKHQISEWMVRVICYKGGVLVKSGLAEVRDLGVRLIGSCAAIIRASFAYDAVTLRCLGAPVLIKEDMSANSLQLPGISARNSDSVSLVPFLIWFVNDSRTLPKAIEVAVVDVLDLILSHSPSTMRHLLAEPFAVKSLMSIFRSFAVHSDSGEEKEEGIPAVLRILARMFRHVDVRDALVSQNGVHEIVYGLYKIERWGPSGDPGPDCATPSVEHARVAYQNYLDRLFGYLNRAELARVFARGFWNGLEAESSDSSLWALSLVSICPENLWNELVFGAEKQILGSETDYPVSRILDLCESGDARGREALELMCWLRFRGWTNEIVPLTKDVRDILDFLEEGPALFIQDLSEAVPESPDPADVVLIGVHNQSQQYQMSRRALASASPVLYALAEGSFREASERNVTIGETDEVVLLYFLGWLHQRDALTQGVSPSKAGPSPSLSSTEIPRVAVGMLVLADRFELPLATLIAALEWLVSLSGPTTATTVFSALCETFGERPEIRSLKRLCMRRVFGRYGEVRTFEADRTDIMKLLMDSPE